jgi:hypothetical protein
MPHCHSTFVALRVLVYNSPHRGVPCCPPMPPVAYESVRTIPHKTVSSNTHHAHTNFPISTHTPFTCLNQHLATGLDREQFNRSRSRDIHLRFCSDVCHLDLRVTLRSNDRSGRIGHSLTAGYNFSAVLIYSCAHPQLRIACSPQLI